MNKAIEPVEQKQIVFNGDELIAVRADDGTVYVPVKPICEQLGVAWQPQARKINSDPVLSDGSMSITIRLQTSADSKRPKNSKMLCLPLDYLNGWLFGINANRVKDAIRPKLIQYQKDVYRVLYEAFTLKQPATAPNADIDAIIAADADLSSVIDVANAMITLARSHAALRLDVADHETRLQLLEADSGNKDRYITNAQARQVADGVQSVAFHLGKQSGRNAHAGVYNELYRRFEIPEYRRLPAVKFDECMTWLKQWYQQLTDDSGAEF